MIFDDSFHDGEEKKQMVLWYLGDKLHNNVPLSFLELQSHFMVE